MEYLLLSQGSSLGSAAGVVVNTLIESDLTLLFEFVDEFCSRRVRFRNLVKPRLDRLCITCTLFFNLKNGTVRNLRIGAVTTTRRERERGIVCSNLCFIWGLFEKAT